jgi:hypothetical protein
LQLDWIEEPFAVGPAYDELRRRTRLRISGGELFWGRQRFEEITQRRWCDVIMPDVKHVGGFGPLLDVLKMGAGRIEISPTSVGADLDGREPACRGRLPGARALARVFVPTAADAGRHRRDHRERRAGAR